MGRPAVNGDEQILESWEPTTEGTTWVWQFDRREDRYMKVRVGGRSGSRRLHITRDDRKFNQEQVVEEMTAHDPFTNGTLRLLESGTRDEHLDVRYHLTQQDLLDLLAQKDESAFAATIEAINSELILRRLLDLADKHATVWQVEALRTLIEARYKRGGTQRTVKEMLDAGERLLT